MVRNQRQQQQRRGRNQRRTVVNRRINRAVRTARNAPLARVRARPTIRGQSLSAASLNAFRRFATFPVKIEKDNRTKWWLEGLKWIGISTMKLLMTALSTATVEEHLRKYPLSIEHPLHGKVVSGSAPTGCITMLAFDYGSFLGESDFVTPLDAGKPGSFGKCHYRQARLEWVKVTITPTAHPSNRGGMIAAALVPSTQKEFQDDFSVIKNEARDFLELLKTPGIVYKTATTPTLLTYSPRPSDEAYNWGCFGVNAVSSSPIQALVYLHIGLSNLATTEANIDEYSLIHSLLDVSVEARVHLREYDEEVYCPFNPYQLVDVTRATETSYNTKISVPLDQYHYHHGIYLREMDLLSMELSP